LRSPRRAKRDLLKVGLRLGVKPLSYKFR